MAHEKTADAGFAGKNKILFQGPYAKRDYLGVLMLSETTNMKHYAVSTAIGIARLAGQLSLSRFLMPKCMESKRLRNSSRKSFKGKTGSPSRFECREHKEILAGTFDRSRDNPSMFEVYYKHPATPQNEKKLGYYKKNIVQSLFSQMLNNRFNELTQQENPPFVAAFSYNGNLTRTLESYVLLAIARENEPVKALENILKESFRLDQHGFTQTELDRAKADYMRNIDKKYKEKDKEKNDKYVWEYFAHFTENEPIPGIEFEYMFSQTLVPAISLQEVNELIKELITVTI